MLIFRVIHLRGQRDGAHLKAAGRDGSEGRAPKDEVRQSEAEEKDYPSHPEAQL